MDYGEKRIALIIPSLESGGMERVMCELANYFSCLSGISCYLILYGKSPEIFYSLSNNVKVIKRDFQFDNKKRILMVFKTMYFIRRSVKRINPDVVLSFGEYWNNLVLFSLTGLSYSIFISDRSNPLIKLGKIHDNIRRCLYPKARGFIAQTKISYEINKIRFPKLNIITIGNPIREINGHLSIKREKIVLSVGRLINSKNFNRLIDIFSSINDPDWRLIIIGADSNKQSNSIYLNRKIKELKMESRIFLVGSQKDVDEFFLKASIFAFTSSSEGFPNVLCEAMSAGLPVVAYDCTAGPSDIIIDGKNGFLIPLFDDYLFIEKLKFLMNDDTARENMGKFARESVSKFSIEKIGYSFFKFLFN